MSQLQKKISQIGRREGGGIGFGSAKGDQPRAMLLGVLAADASAAKAALAAGADVIIARAGADKAKGVIGGAGGNGRAVGAWAGELDEAGASALRDAGCDFVVGTLEGIASGAVDTDKMGLVLEVTAGISDTTLRALPSLGLDGLFLERTPGPMKLADQLELVRLVSFSGSQLLVPVGPETTVAEFRVLRDSGVAVAVAPQGSNAEQIKALLKRLEEVPPRKPRREGADIALVPALAAKQEHEHDDEDDDFE